MSPDPGAGSSPDWPVAADAPAKLNLALDVLGRRDDGYHDIITVFQAIDLMDHLRFRNRDDGDIRLVVEGPEPAPPGQENLVVRAAKLLARRTGTRRGADIHLTKNIPMQSGLGGGSSDAAAALLGLQVLWRTELPAGDLSTLALELGSDVPFFLRGGTALGEGRGELLTALPAPPGCGWLLVVPPFGISTEKAYQAVSPRLTPSEPKTRMLIAALNGGEFEVFAENISNDLEVGVVRIEPRLARIRLEIASRGAAVVGLTGSGSAMFAVFRSQGNADKLLEEGFQPGGARVFSCAPVDFGARVISRSS